ncbi:Uncharacterized protein OS=Planctomyces maris DSM 8797 GN=PM8797T_09894 PE=4 SV=1: DUF748: AsmA_2 [Gemmataceae bacterium]|nr:Uncharacterized protein OS=Planctomyces maris DSM 8797 GN=PM8797T_09894 PE=4 SV=1: DUF748: AsmA_2 [Gemmataceae bacterium]VTT96814.1 Uncharacterized protein OS=Planctomyces maris DSM 8797 GN=PM8797T_09894 PE=4 SV=1: DUF748: AsmA_2 [Gemmataceae bacterium]
MSDPATPPAPSAPHPAARRKWRFKLIGPLAVLLLAVWFAPAVVAKTALRNRIARSAAGDLNGTLDVGDASLGWFSDVELRGITLTDPQGRVVAHVPKVKVGRTLVSLIRDPGDLGEIVVTGPVVEVVCERDTSNLETVLQKLLADTSPPSTGPRTPLNLRVAGGTLTVRDADTGRFSEFREIDATVTVPAARTEPVAIKLASNAPARVDVEASIAEPSRVRVATSGFALEALAPLLRRADPKLGVAGSLTADLTVVVGAGAGSADGTLGVKGLAVTAPALSGDTLRLASAELPVRASVSGGALRVERAELTCDVGTARLAGTFDPGSLDKLLDRPGVQFDASVDVAKLAALLPKVLQVRPGTEVREGRVAVSVASRADGGGTAWSGSVTTSALKAVRGGQEFRWDEPLAIEFVGRARAGELPTFDKLVCKSDFIAVNAQVKPDSVRAAANVYLDRLSDRLSEFVDLGGVELEGEAAAWVVASRSATSDFKAEASVELKRFACLDRTGKGLREPALKLHLTATGTATDAGRVAVSTARLTGTAGGDELDLALLEPIADAKQLATGKFDARASGDLGRWKKRIGAVVPTLNGYQMGGAATARGTVRLVPDALHVDQLSLSIEAAKFRGAGLDIDEPKMAAVADLTVNTKIGTTTFDNFTITSAPLSVARGKLVIEAPATGPTVVYGGGPATSNLNRLGRTLGMFTDAPGPASMYGRATGPIQFRYAGDVTTFNGQLDVANFVLGLRADPAWTEPTMRVEADGSYTLSTDTVALKAASVERPGLKLAAAGSIGKFETTTDANFAGTLAYDHAKLGPKLRELLGPNFTVTGSGTRPVSFAGSLTPPVPPGAKVPPSVFAAATGTFAIGWDSLETHGFAMGPGALRAKLANGVALFAPVSGTFGGGKVAVQPTARFVPAPGELTAAKGLLVDRAKLTPAVCAGAIGYALPAVANSGKAEGEVSFVLDENRVPLNDPQKATVRGNLIVHKATVTGGPVVTEVAKLLGADSGTMTLANEQTVPVRVERGRVFHENLQIKIGGYIIRTTGSVGFDNTLDLVADVPIPGGLPGFKNAPALAKAMTGKRVTVPIKGTLAAPALDQKQFQAAVAKLAQSVAKEVGQAALQKELDKAFPGLIPPGNTGGSVFFPFQRK